MKNYIFIFILSLFVLMGCNEVKEQSSDIKQSTVVDSTEESTANLSTESSKEVTETATQNNTQTLALTETTQVIDTIQTLESNTSEEEVFLTKDILQDEAPSKEWYIHLLVEDLTSHLKTASTQLGQVDSSRAIEAFNLKALAPFGARYLDVVFKNPIGMDAGEYKSDFHVVSNTLDTWHFTVKSHDANATMVLGYRGLFVLSPYYDSEERERYTEIRLHTHPLLAQMVFIDIAENKEIPIVLNAQKNEYLFTMNGQKERHFRLELRPLSAEVKTLRSSLVLKPSSEEVFNRLKIKSLRMDARIQTKKDKKGDFDALPPKFEVLVP